MDYDLIKSGPFMFQDIYLPCDTAQIMRSSERLLPAPYIPCVYNDVHFELELSGQLTDAGCPEKGWCAPPHQQKDQSVIYYP